MAIFSSFVAAKRLASAKKVPEDENCNFCADFVSGPPEVDEQHLSRAPSRAFRQTSAPTDPARPMPALSAKPPYLQPFPSVGRADGAAPPYPRRRSGVQGHWGQEDTHTQLFTLTPTSCY